MRLLTGELSRTNGELAKMVSSVGDNTDVTKVVAGVKDVVESNYKILGELKDNLLPLVRNVSDDIRDLRRDLRSREDRILDSLKKISDNTDKPAAAAAASSSAS